VSRYYDGNYTVAEQEGPRRWTQDPFSKGRLFDVDMVVREAYFKRLDIGHRTNDGFYLYEETSPQNIGGDLLQYTRRYAEVPPPWKTVDRITCPYQFTVSDGSGGFDLAEIAVPTWAIVFYTWGVIMPSSFDNVAIQYQTSIIPQEAYRLAKVNGQIMRVSGIAPAPSDLYILARDSEITQYRGVIYQRKNYYVNRRELAAAALTP
jgi:hypothetical protein